MTQKVKIIIAVSIPLLLLLIVSLSYFLIRKKKPSEKRNSFLPNEENKKEENPQEEMSIRIVDLEPAERSKYGHTHDMLFETERWENAMPFIKFPSEWIMKPLPATKNFLIRFKITDDTEKSPVLLEFDPYGIHTGKPGPFWKIGQGIDNYREISMNQTPELIKTIEQLLEKAPPIVNQSE